MDDLAISRIMVTIASFLITGGLYHQTVKIWQTKSVDDFTWSIVFAFAFNELAWLKYGCALWEWPIILVGAMNMPAVVGLVLGYLRFRKGDVKNGSQDGLT